MSLLILKNGILYPALGVTFAGEERAGDKAFAGACGAGFPG